MAQELKTTPLNGWHRAAGANMADFGGYDMPLWYETGVKNEHLGVLKSAGIFDTSHMACIAVSGKDAFDLLQLCFTRDISSLAGGRCVYGAFLNDKGQSLDDAIVYKFGPDEYMICVNSGMGPDISEHLIAHKKDMNADIRDLTDKVAKMDVQGKNSAKILAKVLKDPDSVFAKMPYFSFKGRADADSDTLLADGTPILLSRSGYTGEFGFEIFISPDAIVKLWKDILEAGKEYEITACGLGSRDSLRAGAVLPLSHQDIGEWKFINHPWDFALPFNEDRTEFTKEFVGRKALEKGFDRYVYPFAGDSLRKVAAGEQTQVLDETGSAIGHVLTCATDMGICWYDGGIYSIASPDLPEDAKIKGISCGFVMVDRKLEYGDRLTLKENKRKIEVTVVRDVRPDRTARKAIKNFI
ncbi:MAG: aminomethyltransferase family protein [Desulfarculaceae bacterium]|nr:aminomethyltransferase family protein [Desulfarculaceae bacterium]